MEAVTRPNLEQVVLELGRSLDWATFRWLPSSWIAPGEDAWRIFVTAHTDEELQVVLDKAAQQVEAGNE